MDSAFDFVVVGGGTAGLCLAARLAEDTSNTVCVLEIGKDHKGNDDIAVPGNYMANFGKEWDAGLLSIPQTHAANRPLYSPRGQGLGGSSLYIVQLDLRAPAMEYDALESMLGATGWNFREFTKYFRKSQILRGTGMPETHPLTPDPAAFGEGPVAATPPRFTPAINEFYFKACADLNIPFNPEGGSSKNSGVWPSLASIHPESAQRAYLEPNRHKENLKIFTEAQATRIVFREGVKPLTATAVEYKHLSSSDEVILTVHARKEVILCAGAYRTPHLLELSGIGDKKNIPGIPQLIDLPGINQDHLSTLFLCETDQSIPSCDMLMNPKTDPAESGMFSAVPLSYSYLTLDQFASPEKQAIIKEMAASADESTTSIASPRSLALLKKWMEDPQAYQVELVMVPHYVPFLPNAEFDPTKKYCFIAAILTHPFSRGSVHTDPSNPLENPILDIGMVESDIDREILVEGIKFIRKLITQPRMRDEAGVRPIAPSNDVKTEEEIKRYIALAGYTSYHPIGTAAMLPREDFGVVDPRLVVYDTTNLRIVRVFTVLRTWADQCGRPTRPFFLSILARTP
ncbi:L-sorbose 1-dehydrogenase [Favolaschia claudopus]|uniref:L-sorbose 1-dehydrogenase n=1 Tax=Favolaschia claudopus TaxID=2862362 RepID=A0AAW0AX59_9AGAR